MQHPGIVPVYELGTFADRCPFFSMKLVKGHTMAALLSARPGPAADLPRFLSVFESVCQTVAYAHARGVIHRDLKPSNIMLGSFGEVQVMDWGLAKILPRGGVVDDATAGKTRDETVIATARSSSDSDAGLSQAGSAMGTPAYMAPEQARGEIDAIDERADVFALGSILAEVLTGQPAFTGRSGGEIQRKAALGDTADVLARLDASGADAPLIALARGCLAREREDRPRDASAVAERITAYLAGVQERVRRAELASVEERARRRLTTVVAASLLALSTAGGLGFTYWLQQRQASTARADLALQEATLLHDQAECHPDDPARWPSALEGLKRAEAALADSGDPSVRRQLAALGAKVRAGAEAADRDRELVAKLDDIRSSTSDDLGSSSVDAAYAVAFREAGLNVEGPDPKKAGAGIAGRPEPVRQALVAALDHWVWVRKSLGARGETWPKLVAVARSADPDPNRDALRAALATGDQARRLEQLRPLVERADPAAWAPASLVLLARTLDDAGDVEGGVRVLRRAACVHPTDAQVHYNLGRLLYYGTKPPRPEEAVAAYGAARALGPEAGHGLAHAMEKLGRTEEAEAVLRDLVARRPDHAAHMTCLGQHLRTHGRAPEADAYFERAVAVSREAVRLRPEDATAYYNMGRSLFNKNQTDEAIASYRRALELDPQLSLAHSNLGDLLYSKGRTDEAIASLRKALELDPKLASAHCSLGGSLMRKGRPDEAIACYRKALELDPKYASAHHGLAIALYSKGRTDEAIASYRKALELDPKLAMAHNNLAFCLMEVGDLAGATRSVDEALRLDPKHDLASATRAEILLVGGRFAEAVVALEGAIPLLKTGENRGMAATYEGLLPQARRLAGQADVLKALGGGGRDLTALELAARAREQGRSALAARLASVVLTVSPYRANDLKAGHRHAAARDAALAGTGGGKDDPAPDDGEKARLRSQAFGWLKADLSAWKGVAKGTEPADMERVAGALTSWQQDLDLVGVRDFYELTNLPEAERKDWQALWAEVEALRDRVGGKTP